MEDDRKQSRIQQNYSQQMRYLMWQNSGLGQEDRIAVGDYEIVPLFFQWNSRDKKILSCFGIGKDGKSGEEGRFQWLWKRSRKLAVAYFRRQYREVFLENTETLFLSEKVRKEIPAFLWKSEPQERWELHWSYARKIFWEILDRTETPLTLVLAIPDECNLTIFEEWMEEIWEEPLMQSAIADFLFIGSSQQRENCEEILDLFYEQTGIAGSFYDNIKQYKREMAERVYTDNSIKRNVLFLDCFGVSLKETGKVTFYIDGAGIKTKGELRKMESAGITCKSLRKYLDSTFLSKL